MKDEILLCPACNHRMIMAHFARKKQFAFMEMHCPVCHYIEVRKYKYTITKTATNHEFRAFIGRVNIGPVEKTATNGVLVVVKGGTSA